MMEFLILTSSIRATFEQLVNKALNDGWDFHGYVFTTTGRDYQGILTDWYHQAFTRKVKS